MYPASFWFEVPSSAYVFLIVINLFIGITATVATFLLQLFEHDKVGGQGAGQGDVAWGSSAEAVPGPQDLKVVNSYLKSCFLIFPNYNLGHGLMEMAYNEYINEYYAKIGERGPPGTSGAPCRGGWGSPRPHTSPELAAPQASLTR
jgi:ATP-binding cassette subfamily A (ABC1) protein 2